MSRPAASARVARMLSLVPWVAARGGASVEEICGRFEIDEEQLLSDLTTVSMVGLYPYTPDVLIDLQVEDGYVTMGLPQAFDRPLSLTPEQGLVLVAAGATLLATPGADPDGPLARGLAKLAGVLDAGGSAEIDVRLGDVATDVLAVLREGRRQQRQVAIEYYAYGRDELTRRTIDPHRVSTDQGQWYVAAYCHLAADERLFRIDRVRSAHLLDERFEAIEAGDPSTDDGVFNPTGLEPRVVLVLAPEARWVVEQYPVVDVVELPGGRLRVTLVVTAQAWLERLLLRLGPQAEVLDAPDDLRRAGVEAARRVLLRYRSTRSGD